MPHFLLNIILVLARHLKEVCRMHRAHGWAARDACRDGSAGGRAVAVGEVARLLRPLIPKATESDAQ